ncbi:MAG: RNA-binding transcriptional accessory protein [Bacteroidetes bacterium]|nr:MAG: RNA-binding transcriptional accessory protein [Bacteroidota bacterium]
MIVIEDVISRRTNIPVRQVKNTVELLEQGATIPFISRYRKEHTGSLDELKITGIRDELNKLKELGKRKEYILKAIADQDKLSGDLKKRIEACLDPVELEDLYLPYRKKRKTRATIAREKGLEPLAKILMRQQEMQVEKAALAFVGEGLESVEDALQGARDIIAEWINENQGARKTVRYHFDKEAVIYSRVVKSKADEEGAVKYKDYFEFSEPLRKCPGHRILAMRRGEHEGFLKLSIAPDTPRVIRALEERFVKSPYDVGQQVAEAVQDAYKRLIHPSIENEYQALHKEKADEEAIRVFAENLRQLLLAAPLGQKRVLALDPGFRTGCKVVCLDAQGNLLHNATIYPHPPQSDRAGATRKISSLAQQYKIEAIAIGNGTASRETERFIRMIRFDREMEVYVVNESGASIYSASKTAREEFPDYDVTVRGAVSIGRRLMDPLAELVKIDPKSIGVGQYQHDVDQGKLKKSLDEVVGRCVNLVGVNVNTSSTQLLTYVSGLGPVLAKNVVEHRQKIGGFSSREQLKEVPRMGEKAFEQCAGFLRIDGGVHPLDNSAVHPESYHIVERMATDLGVDLKALISDEKLVRSIELQHYLSEGVGLPTLKDIKAELEKPGRDPRAQIEVFEFDQDVHSLDDLKAGMELPGIVTNITKFGAFVDVGVKQDGLVHISQLADRFIKDPNDVVNIHQHVKVRVLEIDVTRKRIQLSMKGLK